MATAKDLIPSKYEVIKMTTGSEIVGMTRDLGDNLEITLPMICHLSIIPGSVKTQVIFYPYSPLSEEEKIVMPKTSVMHRTSMNEQFIPHYDNASSLWMKMIENKSIPIGDEKSVRKDLDTRIKRAMDRLMTQSRIESEMDYDDYILEDIGLDSQGFDVSSAEDLFETLEKPEDPKKIH